MNEKKILLVGNPNCGKTTLFNRLTGLSQKTGNFHGVTVEKKTGFIKTDSGNIQIWDLPGSFSLEGNSEDRKVTAKEILGRGPEDKIIFVMDSLQMERGFQFLLSLIDSGAEILVVLTMKDLLARRGIDLNLPTLEKETGLKFFLLNPKSGDGVQDLSLAIPDPQNFRRGKRIWSWKPKSEKVWKNLSSRLNPKSDRLLDFSIHQSLVQGQGNPFTDLFSERQQNFIAEARSNGDFYAQTELIQKSIAIKKLLSKSIRTKSEISPNTWSKVDRVLLDPIYGVLVFFLCMGFIFQLLFTWAEIPMEALESLVGFFQDGVREYLPPGPVADLIVDGVLGGVGSVIVFIPQIALLFFFIGIMEESGYMSRVSFVMDRSMGKFGLSGKSFIPLLSSAACAVPAIMSTRTIENKSDRMTTIMISPLVMCSARYPVYILVVGTVFNSEPFFGWIRIQGLVLLGMFLLGLGMSLTIGLLFKNFVFKEVSSYFLMEMPDYKMPSLRVIAHTVFGKVSAFLRSAGQIILFISILLWAISYYPIQKTEDSYTTDIKSSYAAKIGKWMEPVIEPLGYDWKIGISLIASFAAREVMVSTLAILYGVEISETQISESTTSEDIPMEERTDLREEMKKDIRADGTPLWTPLTGISILIFFAFASQCMSTLAVVRRETNSYFWPFFQFLYMTLLAYVSAFFVYQVGTFLGF
jgi:ferrous iron transport protein B